MLTQVISPWTQNFICGVVLFLTVGIYLAITGKTRETPREMPFVNPLTLIEQDLELVAANLPLSRSQQPQMLSYMFYLPSLAFLVGVS